MPVSTLQPNPRNLSGKPREEKWTPPELVSPIRTPPRSHTPPHRDRTSRHYIRPSWKRNPKPTYKKILTNPEAVRDDLELPQYIELRHIPENIDQEHKQALYYNQILHSRDRSFTTQHESTKKDIHEGQVCRTTLPAKKHELPPDRREKFETIIQDQRYDEDCVERDEWKGHGWLERARAELKFPREFDRLWEEWMLRGRRTTQQERELEEREREIEREEQEGRILEYVRRNMEERERIKRKVLVEDRVERKLIPRLRGGMMSWEEVEKERLWYGEGDDGMKNEVLWPEALRYIDFVPLRSFPGEFTELPGEFENPLELHWGYWYKDAYERLLEQEEERRQQAESEHENDDAGDAKWYRIIVSEDFAKDCSIVVDWHKPPHVANDEYEAFVSDYWLGWIFVGASDDDRFAGIRSIREFGPDFPEGRLLDEDELEALLEGLEDDLEDRMCIEYRITADLHFGEHGDEDWVVDKREGVKFLVGNEMVLRRAVLEEDERRGGVERPGIVGVQESIDGGETVKQWGIGDMQNCRTVVLAEARLHRILFEDAAASGRDIHGKGKGKGRATDAAGPREKWGRAGASNSWGERPNLAVIVPEQPAFADVDAAELLRQQFMQTHGKKKANQATVEDDDEEEEL